MHGDSILLFKLWALRFNDFNLYVMGQKYVLPLLSSILVLCNRVKSSKATSYLSCPEENILSLVDKMFQHISVLFSRLIADHLHVTE